MTQTGLRWWRFVSPTVVTLWRLSILVPLTCISVPLRQPTLYAFTFWAVVAVNLVLYFNCCFRDPGFQEKCPSSYLSDQAIVEKIRKHLCSLPVLSSPKKRRRRWPITSSSSDGFGFPSGVPIPRRVFHEDEASSSSMFSADHPVLDLGSDGDSDFHHLEVSGPPLAQETPAVKEHVSITVLQRSLDVECASAQQKQDPHTFGLAAFYKMRKAYRCVSECLDLFWCVPLASAFTRTSVYPKSQLLTPADLTLGVKALYIDGHELNFCRQCRWWQNMRTKHCKDCGRCVKLHDHHCPWLGVCVGERTRTLFCQFLGWQSLELGWSVCEIVAATLVRDVSWLNDDEGQSPNFTQLIPRIYLLSMVFILLCVIIMTISLLTFQICLLSTNLTTWESICWKRVSYLKSRDKRAGSPFTARTALCNLRLAALALRKDAEKEIAALDSADLALRSAGDGQLLWVPLKRKGGSRRETRLCPQDSNLLCLVSSAETTPTMLASS